MPFSFFRCFSSCTSASKAIFSHCRISAVAFAPSFRLLRSPALSCSYFATNSCRMSANWRSSDRIEVVRPEGPSSGVIKTMCALPHVTCPFPERERQHPAPSSETSCLSERLNGGGQGVRWVLHSRRVRIHAHRTTTYRPTRKCRKPPNENPRVSCKTRGLNIQPVKEP